MQDPVEDPRRPIETFFDGRRIYHRLISEPHVMLKTIRFFKIAEGPQAGWYADIPNHSLEENEMIAGSADFLEKVNHLTDKNGEVIVTCSDNNEAGTFIAKLLMKNHNQWGATHILTGPKAEKYNAVGFELWICNVTHDVLGEHPRSIYIHNIQ